MQGAQRPTKQSIEDQILGGLPLGDKKRALHLLSMFARYGRLITDFSVLQNARNCCLETAVYIGGLLRPLPFAAQTWLKSDASARHSCS